MPQGIAPTSEARRSGGTLHEGEGLSGAGIPWKNLTEGAEHAGGTGASTFDGDSLYETFFDRVCRALHRSRPHHVMITAERGVAEHAVLLELARRGLLRHPPFLADKQIFLLHCRHIAGDQMPALFQTLSGAGAPAGAIFCLDGYANVLRAAGRSEVLRTMLLAALTDTPARVVGVLAPTEFESLCAGDAEIIENFSLVELPEPEPATARRLVRHFAAGLETHYRVRIEDEAIDRAVVLSDQYILNERLPYKAVKILQGSCEDLDYDRSQHAAKCTAVTAAEVVKKIAQVSGVPVATLAGMGEGVDYRLSLNEMIVGQEHAVNEVATELGLIKAGMSEADKPASVMMFVGQTGTGKTEMAKALARLYSSSKRLKTFTLGNFSEPHSVSGIIGVPAGYVGHDQGGRLVNELNADPYGVFLLDEADKAHPDVMQPFLNLFDEGWIADQKGNRAYAHRAIFILTTNVGQRQIADMCRSGKGEGEIATAVKDLLSRIRHGKSNRPVFSPEFLARVRRLVVFRSLDQEAMVGICRRILAALQSEWQVKRLKALTVPECLIRAIGGRAFALDVKSQGREGGRIVRKLIADVIEARIQHAIGAAPATYRECRTVEITFTPPQSTGDSEDLVRCIGVTLRPQ
ncbi:MAG: AAA family ATPase [Planctomycetia bacterium]|nr:AAA family ATPase [Planctomycetia bacterium]